MRRKSAPLAAVATRAAIWMPRCRGFRDTPMTRPDCGTAADVGIDVSCVHRCFGSKESIFAQVLAGDQVVG